MCVGGGVSDVGHVAAGASGVVDVFLVLLLSLTLVVVVLVALLFIRVVGADVGCVASVGSRVDGVARVGLVAGAAGVFAAGFLDVAVFFVCFVVRCCQARRTVVVAANA